MYIQYIQYIVKAYIFGGCTRVNLHFWGGFLGVKMHTKCGFWGGVYWAADEKEEEKKKRKRKEKKEEEKKEEKKEKKKKRKEKEEKEEEKKKEEEKGTINKYRGPSMAKICSCLCFFQRLFKRNARLGMVSSLLLP